MPFVDIEDARVEYRVDGQGSGMLLIHGSGRDADSTWGGLGERLAAAHKVVRPSFSGSGETRDRDRPLTLESLARQVVASAWASRAAPFDLVGIGLGGAVAAYVAATLPDLARSLVMISGFADAGHPALALQLRLRRALAEQRPDLLAGLMVSNDHSPSFLTGLEPAAVDEAIRRLTAGLETHRMARQLDLEIGLNLERVLPGVRCPTLLVACEQDRLVPAECTAALAQAIPQARLVRLPTGHLAPLEAPDQLAQLLMEFSAQRRPAMA